MYGVTRFVGKQVATFFELFAFVGEVAVKSDDSPFSASMAPPVRCQTPLHSLQHIYHRIAYGWA